MTPYQLIRTSCKTNKMQSFTFSYSHSCVCWFTSTRVWTNPIHCLCRVKVTAYQRNSWKLLKSKRYNLKCTPRSHGWWMLHQGTLTSLTYRGRLQLCPLQAWIKKPRGLEFAWPNWTPTSSMTLVDSTSHITPTTSPPLLRWREIVLDVTLYKPPGNHVILDISTEYVMFQINMSRSPIGHNGDIFSWKWLHIYEP